MLLDLVLAAALAWLVCLPTTLFADQVFTMRDAAFSTVAMSHLQEAVLGRATWTDAPLAWPLSDTVTQADWTLGPAILTLPLRFLGVPALYQYVAAVWAGLTLGALSMKHVAGRLIGEGPWTWVAAIVGGLNVSAILHAQHVNLVFHGVPWLGLLAAAIGIREDRPRLAALGGAVVALSFHFGMYIGLHGVFVGVLAVIPGLLTRTGSWRTWGAMLAGFVAVFLTMVPVLAVYASSFHEQHSVIPHMDLNGESLDLSRILAPIRGSLVHGPLERLWPAGVDRPALDPPNPGYLATILAIGGAVVAWRRRSKTLAWLACAGFVAAILALGPDIMAFDRGWAPAPYRLLLWLPGFAGLRAPVRWLEVVWPAVAVFAALGARVVGERTNWPRLTVGIIGALLLIELPRVVGGPLEEVRPADFYADLASLPPGPVADMIRGGARSDTCSGQQRLLATLVHHRPIVGGQYARFSAPLAELNKVAGNWPTPTSVSALEAIGAAVVVEHPPLSANVPPEIRCVARDGHRLCVVPKRAAPIPKDVTDIPSGPVVAMRYRGKVDAPFVRLSCDGQAEDQPLRAWKVVAQLRSTGEKQPPIDVFFDVPCTGVASSSPPGGTPLYAGSDLAWP